MGEVLGLFSTPLYKARVEIDPNINKDFLDTIPYRSYSDKSGWSSKDGKILLNKNFKCLKEKIDKHVENFLYQVLKIAQGRPKHTQSWINKHGPKGFSSKHYHSNSFISGGLYLECPPNCGGIVFQQSHNHLSWCANTIRPAISELTMWNADSWAFEVQKGDLLLFPSHLLHRVEDNMSDKDRYMIAFNYFLEGEIGSHTGALNLRCLA
mgnify:FL=1